MKTKQSIAARFSRVAFFVLVTVSLSYSATADSEGVVADRPTANGRAATQVSSENQWAFFSSFDRELPPNTKLYGNAKMVEGILKLTTSARDQIGTLVIDPGRSVAVTGFEVTFKALVGGGTGADGFGFLFSPDLPDGVSPPGGHPGCNLAIEFETYDHGSGIAPGIVVHSADAVLLEAAAVELRKNRFVDVLIRLNPDNTLDVSYDNIPVFRGFKLPKIRMTGKFALTARTGARTDSHFIDDLRIVAQTAPSFVQKIEPDGNNSAPDCRMEFHVRDGNKPLDAHLVRLHLDDEDLIPEIIKQGSESIIVAQSSSLHEPGSAHTVTLTLPVVEAGGAANSFTYSFRVSDLVGITKR